MISQSKKLQNTPEQSSYSLVFPCEHVYEAMKEQH